MIQDEVERQERAHVQEITEGSLPRCGEGKAVERWH